MFTSQLAALVTKGTITAAQEKSIVAALKSSMGSAMPGGQGGQPSAGATPGAQPSAGATPGAQAQGGPPDMSSMFTTALDPLVKAGTITVGAGEGRHRGALDAAAGRARRRAAVRPSSAAAARRLRLHVGVRGGGWARPGRAAASALDQLDRVAVRVADEGDARAGALEQVRLPRWTVPPAATIPGSTASMSSTSKAKWPKRSPPS